MLRILAVLLIAGLAILETGCGCCSRNTMRPSAPPCCPQSGGIPVGVIPGPPPGTANFSPAGLPAAYGR